MHFRCQQMQVALLLYKRLLTQSIILNYWAFWGKPMHLNWSYTIYHLHNNSLSILYIKCGVFQGLILVPCNISFAVTDQAMLANNFSFISSNDKINTGKRFNVFKLYNLQTQLLPQVIEKSTTYHSTTYHQGCSKKRCSENM